MIIKVEHLRPIILLVFQNIDFKTNMFFQNLFV